MYIHITIDSQQLKDIFASTNPVRILPIYGNN